MLIDNFSPDCFAKLRHRATSVLPEYSVYVLIDGAFSEGIHKIFSSEEKRILFDSLPSCSLKTQDVSPFLIEFNPLDKRIGVLFDRCSGWPMISTIETTESLSALSIRLAEWCVVEADGSRFNFRFADTRRIPAICRTLTSHQRSSFLGPAANWSIISRNGLWETIDMKGCPYQSRPSVLDPSFEKSQFHALIDDSRADEIFAVMAYRGEKPYGTPSRVWNSIVAALKMSVGANLSDSDTIEWAIWHAKNYRDESQGSLHIELQEWMTAHCIIERNGEQALDSLLN